jgi:uncharacterized membrane protein YbjE (DUF340 family)
MITVIAIMAIGIATGFFIRTKKNLVSLADRLTMWSIYLLLFLLGIAIGANKIIVSNLHTLGFKALIITLGGILGSVLLSWVVYHLLFKRDSKKHEG